jgi:hypothetical protein
MADIKQITSISVVTDTETGDYFIGEIDGGYMDKDWLKDYIRRHGPNELFKLTAWINFQTFGALREVNSEGQQADCKAAPMSNNPIN